MNYGTCRIRGHPGGRHLVPINTWLNREGSFFPVCSWLQCLVCWLLSHDLSVAVLAYPTCKIVMLRLCFSVTSVWVVLGSCSYHFPFGFNLAFCRCFSAGMWRLCCVWLGIQFWPAQGTLPQYGQWFPGIDHKSCTFGSVPFFFFFFARENSLLPAIVVGLDGLVFSANNDKALSFDGLQLSFLLFLGIIRALVIFGIP